MLRGTSQTTSERHSLEAAFKKIDGSSPKQEIFKESKIEVVCGLNTTVATSAKLNNSQMKIPDAVKLGKRKRGSKENNGAAKQSKRQRGNVC